MGMMWDLFKSFETFSNRCPRCNYPVNKSMEICKECSQKLKWKN